MPNTQTVCTTERSGAETRARLEQKISREHGVAVEFANHGRNELAREFLSLPNARTRTNRTVQCDGTLGMTFVEKSGGQRPGCWAHARRRLMACARGGDGIATEGLKHIAALFLLERNSAAGESEDARRDRRRRDCPVVLQTILEWLDEGQRRAEPKSALGKALGYIKRQWPRLVLFVNDPRAELTNNRVEREIRAVAVGRKNWLFVETEIGGARCAVMETVIGTCVAQGINPLDYLQHVLQSLIVGNTDYESLVPQTLAQKIPSLKTTRTAA